MISLRDQELLRQRFQRDLNSRVRIDYFTQKPSSIYIPGRQECVYCEDVGTALHEIASLSERIVLSVHELEETGELAGELGVDKVPGIVIRGQNNRPLRFFGAPLGNEFPGLIETLLDAARGGVDLEPTTLKSLRKLKSDVRLQVMVTPTCPHSPALARTAFKLALQSVRVKVDVVEITEFPALIQRYGVRAVPTTVIDEKTVLPGAMDETMLVEMLLHSAEGKPMTGLMRAGAVTPLAAPPTQKPAQQPPVHTVGPSGLIIPR